MMIHCIFFGIWWITLDEIWQCDAMKCWWNDGIVWWIWVYPHVWIHLKHGGDSLVHERWFNHSKTTVGRPYVQARWNAFWATIHVVLQHSSPELAALIYVTMFIQELEEAMDPWYSLHTPHSRGNLIAAVGSQHVSGAGGSGSHPYPEGRGGRCWARCSGWGSPVDLGLGGEVAACGGCFSGPRYGFGLKIRVCHRYLSYLIMIFRIESSLAVWMSCHISNEMIFTENFMGRHRPNPDVFNSCSFMCDQWGQYGPLLISKIQNVFQNIVQNVSVFVLFDWKTLQPSPQAPKSLSFAHRHGNLPGCGRCSLEQLMKWIPAKNDMKWSQIAGNPKNHHQRERESLIRWLSPKKTECFDAFATENV